MISSLLSKLRTTTTTTAAETPNKRTSNSNNDSSNSNNNNSESNEESNDKKGTSSSSNSSMVITKFEKININSSGTTQQQQKRFYRGGKNRDDCFAMMFDDVLTEDECNTWKQLAEDVGYAVAKVNIGHKEILISSYRNSQRCIIDNTSMANMIFERIYEHLPKTYGFGRATNDVLSSKMVPYRLLEINERLRFLKYNQGDYFRPHSDGCYERTDESSRSFLTIMIYLNHGDGIDFRGGRTLFLNDKKRTYVDSDYDENDILYALTPKPGRVLVFDHSMFHAGEDVLSGTKLCVRSDIMYTTTIPT